MKANQKFLKSEDAVSPVIGVILMVAITVVLAATVYVWASGFGRGGEATRAIALASDSALDPLGNKNYTITAASPSLRWTDIQVQVDGTTLGLDANCDGTAAAGKFQACQGTTLQGASDFVSAGQTLRVPATEGATLRIIDAQANAVLYTVLIG